MGLIFNISIAVFAATGSFLFGYDSGVMTDVIQSPNFLSFFGTNPETAIIGAINAVFSGGAVFGSLMGGFTMDSLGRKWTVQIGAMICLLGAILQSAARNLAMILVGRIIAGWAVGLMSMSVPVYQSECAHPNTRGLIVGLTQQMIGVGFIVSTWIGYGSSKVPATSAFSWRFPLAFQAVPALMIAVGMIWFPESPRHLMEKDKPDEAMKVVGELVVYGFSSRRPLLTAPQLRKLHYNGHNAEWLQSEFNEIQITIQAEKAITAPGWLVMFKVPQWRTRLMHATLIQVFTQMTG